MAYEYIEIENYQKHAEMRVDFDKSITTIIGVTDAGKSAVLRAIRWVCLNLPAGTAMLRQGADGVVCRLGVDGHVVQRSRLANGINSYSVDAGEPLVAFGTGVPDVVRDLVQVDQINFVGQKEADFWLSLSSVEVSRRLNAVVDLGVIDDAHERIGKLVWRGQESVRVSADELEAAKARVGELEWVRKANVELQELEQMESVLLSKQQHADTLRKLLNRCMESERIASKAVAQSAAMTAIVRSGVVYENLCVKRDTLRQLVLSITNAERWRHLTGLSVDAVDGVLRRYQSVQSRYQGLIGLVRTVRAGLTLRDAVASRMSFEVVGSLYQQWDMVATKWSGLRSHVRVCRDSETAWQSRQRLVRMAEDAIPVAVPGSACPLCGALVTVVGG